MRAKEKERGFWGKSYPHFEMLITQKTKCAFKWTTTRVTPPGGVLNPQKLSTFWGVDNSLTMVPLTLSLSPTMGKGISTLFYYTSGCLVVYFYPIPRFFFYPVFLFFPRWLVLISVVFYSLTINLYLVNGLDVLFSPAMVTSDLYILSIFFTFYAFSIYFFDIFALFLIFFPCF